VSYQHFSYSIDSLKEYGLPEQEGQLLVDVVETENSLVIRTAIAGVKAEDLDIHITLDTVTIRGKRSFMKTDCDQIEMIHIQECHWGEFSRSIILPTQIHPEKSQAILQAGILTISLPKAHTDSQIQVFELES